MNEEINPTGLGISSTDGIPKLTTDGIPKLAEIGKPTNEGKPTTLGNNIKNAHYLYNS